MPSLTRGEPSLGMVMQVADTGVHVRHVSTLLCNT